MAVYVIGDLQGCYKKLKKLLKLIKFDATRDFLWFAGDLVNRGPDSLKTLRFVKDLGDRATVVLGNHDLHLLAVYYQGVTLKSGDTLNKVMQADDSEELMSWLRTRPLLHHDVDLNFSMVHAGIYPGWTISQSLALSAEVEAVLAGDDYVNFFASMYGNKPARWSKKLRGMSRLRFITNVFTRMRYLHPDLTLDLAAKGAPSKASNSDVVPWFEFRQSAIKFNRVAFGHWSTLPTGQYGNCFALDSGCVWGGQLTALRIDKKTPRWYHVSCA